MNTATNTTNRRVLKGTVVSNAMEQTVTVAVDRYVQHPKYKKYVRRTKKFLVHDGEGAAQIGDTVDIIECTPISKRKRFHINRVHG